MEEHMQPAVLALSDATRDTLAGAISGICGVIVGQPLDVIRVRQQQREGGPAGTAGRATHLASVFSNEGYRALFRGMAYPLASTALQNALVFHSYGTASRFLHMPVAMVAAAGGWAGLVQTSICTPVELLKIRLQLQTTQKGQPGHLGSIDMLARILRTEGIRGLYRGTAMTAARDVPSFASYFAAFEATRERFDPEGCAGTAEPRPLVILAAGAAAGVAAWITVYPLDLIKSRLQALPGPGPGSWRIAREIAMQDGWRGFFKGFGPTMGRALLVNAAIFSSFEACHAWLRGLDGAAGANAPLTS